MLIALAIYLFSGGGNGIGFFPENFSNRVENVVLNDTRQEEITNLVEKIDERVKLYNNEIEEFAEEVSQLNQNYASTEKEFEQIVQNALQKRKSLQTEVLNARMKMVDLIELNEWQQIFSEEKEKND